jgi:hypothetical protein
LTQARDAFRHALHDAAFGELQTGDDQPQRSARLRPSRAPAVLEQFVRHWNHVVVSVITCRPRRTRTRPSSSRRCWSD